MSPPKFYSCNTHMIFCLMFAKPFEPSPCSRHDHVDIALLTDATPSGCCGPTTCMTKQSDLPATNSPRFLPGGPFKPYSGLSKAVRGGAMCAPATMDRSFLAADFDTLFRFI